MRLASAMDSCVRCNGLFPVNVRYDLAAASYRDNDVKPEFHLLAAAILVIATPALAAENDIEGRWLSGDKTGWIDIRLVDGAPIGRASGSTTEKPGDPPRLDDLNPDPALRSRRLLGIVILQGFRYAGNGVWKGGTIYDPNSGNTYKSTLTLVDGDTLKVRGYVGISVFGRSDTWTRDDP